MNPKTPEPIRDSSVYTVESYGEHWFTWINGNAAAHREKHGLPFSIAKRAFNERSTADVEKIPGREKLLGEVDLSHDEELAFFEHASEFKGVISDGDRRSINQQKLEGRWPNRVAVAVTYKETPDKAIEIIAARFATSKERQVIRDDRETHDLIKDGERLKVRVKEKFDRAIKLEHDKDSKTKEQSRDHDYER